MLNLTTATFQRPDDLRDRTDPATLYARSYLLIRTVVGAIGVLLPFVLWAVDALVLHGSLTARGSLSAYYHSGARDLFVGALCITGCLLLTYLAAQPRTWDYWLSTVAGVAVLGVALLPTSRPDMYGGPPTPLQERWGEQTVATIHFTCAAVFILSLAALCFVFAHRDQRYGGRPRLHRACGIAILAAVAWVALGLAVDLSIGWLTSLYLGEVVSVWAFGTSWLVKGFDLLHLTRASVRSTPGL
ncbi:MAG TPA: hypothetical protein VFT70_10115 [Nocardioides sp.]|nr:hypothetical protein [Nocardioides sp.]